MVKFRSIPELVAFTDDELQAHYWVTVLARKEADSEELREYQQLVLDQLDNRFDGEFLSWPGNWSYSWKLL